MTTTTDELLNALAEQNDYLANLVAIATDADELDRAELVLQLVTNVWDAVGYGYKVAEVRRRIAARAEHLILVERAYLAGCRKNDRTRGRTEADIVRLSKLATI